MEKELQNLVMFAQVILMVSLYTGLGLFVVGTVVYAALFSKKQ